MNRLRRPFGTAAVLALAVMSGCTDSSRRVKLAAGPLGGTWYALAGSLKNVIEHHADGVWVQVVPGGGVANVKAVEIDRADVALANSVSTVDAINGEPPFTARATHVCNLATLYPQYYQVVTLAASGIRTPADFKGRALATQPRGNTAEIITQHFLKVNGLTYSDLKVSFVSYTDAVSQMQRERRSADKYLATMRETGAGPRRTGTISPSWKECARRAT